MQEGNVVFSGDPGLSALQNCFKHTPQAGRSVRAGEGSASFANVSMRCSRLLSQARTSLMLLGKAFWK